MSEWKAWCSLVVAMCRMPHDSGACGEYNIKWMFDASRGQCARSWDSGCDVDDAHRFDSEHDCAAVCVNPPAPYGTTPHLL